MVFSTEGASHDLQIPGRRPGLQASDPGRLRAGLAYLLIGEHRVHLLGWAPFLLLLLCPLLHMTMHGGHGGGHGPDHPGDRARPPAPEA
ncbi:DUF2933 domain-containing protein [Brevundimonas diminuta]|uniref:Protein of uncharacterized function (DUF2933) n=1 Tax=Brevundimonas diminuta TaxID=293 RepID=A0A2X1B6X3_BREDI|nr:DUF2933 domain-containing protein [Brevundimonas diminuta]SPU46574.1 Protein of uncharacterised function (DUF2933) [Brevundimonas diminuta]